MRAGMRNQVRANAQGSQIAATIERLTGVLTETVINTIKYLAIAVPNTAGAKAVFLKRIVQIASKPDMVASTLCVVNTLTQMGNLVPTVCEMSQAAPINKQSALQHSDATPLPIFCNWVGPFELANMSRRIPKHTDGSYYITASVKSENASAGVFGSVTYAAEFEVWR